MKRSLIPAAGRRRLAVSTGTVFFALTLLASCGNDKTGTTQGGKPEAAQIKNQVEVDATEYSFLMPDEVQGGVVTFDLENTGAELHEFGFGRVEEGKTIEDVKAAFESDVTPSWLEDLAGIAALSPGRTVTMTRELKEGTYLFACFFPSPQGKSHFALGMHKMFTVTGGSDGELPQPDATVTMTDDGIEVPEIAEGSQLLELRNEGNDEHGMLFLLFEGGKTFADLDKWIRTGYRGPAPATALGGIQTIPTGASIFEEMEFESGRTYVIMDLAGEQEAKFTVK